MADPVILAQGLGFAYQPGHLVLEGLSLEIRDGERVGIVGANGAGKSTLLLLLAGGLAPGVGRLTVQGVEASPRGLAGIRRHAGLVFQNPEDMLFMPTVGADVAFGPQHQGVRPGDVEKRVRRALTAVGALDLADRPPWGLSGGEKRAASIAAVLAMEPSILLMDEPSSGLDPASRRELARLITTLPGALIVASHDLDLVMDVCERVVVLGSGRVIADAKACDVLADRALLEAHRLELPLRLQACPVCGAARFRGPATPLR